MRPLTGRQAVALHPLSRLERYERRACSRLAGLCGRWPTAERRQPAAE
ncbi:hypothetical protein ACFY4B_25650 [Kitasatospora sp. NPDC001261]